MKLRLQRLLWLGFVVLVLVATIAPMVRAVKPASPWLAASPELTKHSTIASAQLPFSLSGNRDCQQQEVITRPARLLPPQTKQSFQGCAINTSYGAYDYTGFLQRPSSAVFGRVVTSSSTTANMLPIPYSATGLIMTSGPANGGYMFYTKELDKNLATNVIANGEVTHTLPAGYSGGVKDVAGHLLPVDVESVSFSSNGLWMVASLPGIGMARIDAQTFQVVPFGDAVNYNIGLGTAFRTTVSPDGRYAAVASMNFEIFKLYDLSTCGAVPTTITTKVPCSSRDLLPLVRLKLPGFRNVVQMRFRDDYTLDTYLGAYEGAGVVYSHQALVAGGQQAAAFQYLGLGDSFASGEGAYSYKSSTDTTQNKCHLSQKSYPYLLSEELGFGLYESLACSGAVIKDLSGKSATYNAESSQAKGKSEAIYNNEILSFFLPGYRTQKTFVEEYQPETVTISAVGNDIGFGDKIKRCIDTDTCYNTYEDRLEIINEVSAQFYRLTDVYKQLRDAGRPDMRVYVIGYPQMADPSGNCAANVHLNRQELIFAQQLISYLNSMIKKAAANQGVFYVDVEDAFVGHRLCETDSWNVAVNGLTQGNDVANIPFIHGPIGNESFHPNAFGHELLKTAILAKTAGLTTAMPQPNSAAVLAAIDPALPFLNAPKANRPVRFIKNATGTNGGVIEVGKNQVTRLAGQGISNIGGKVKAWLFSEPYFLGEFTVDTNGDIPLSFTIPSSTSPGYHTIHIYGQNTSGEEIDTYMVIYVSGTSATVCGAVPAANQDTDRDRIDDACDGFIAQAPPEPEPEPEPEPIDSTPPLDTGNDTLPELPPVEDSPPAEPDEPIQEPSTPQPDADTPQESANPDPNPAEEDPATQLQSRENTETSQQIVAVLGAAVSSQNQPIVLDQQSDNDKSSHQPQVAASTTQEATQTENPAEKTQPTKEKGNNLLLLLLAMALLGLYALRRHHQK